MSSTTLASSSAHPRPVPASPDDLHDRPVRFAVVGTGGMGGHHARNLAAMPDVDLTWLVDIDLPRAQALAAEIGGTPTASMEEAFAAENVDAVLIALPTFLHKDATVLAAQHGKHVFCEKPIARTVEDGEAMVAACDAAGVTFMVGHVVRFFPEYERMKEILDKGNLGRIATIRASRTNPPVMERSPWFADIEKNGGVVLDLMIHEIDTLRWLFGDVERVFAHGLSFLPVHEKRDYTMASIRFRSGAIAHVEASWAHSTHRTFIEVAGQYGLATYGSEDAATLIVEPTVGIDWNAPEGIKVPARQYLRPGVVAPHLKEVQHFVSCLKTGQPVRVNGEEATKALAVANAVLDSMRTGAPVFFNEDGTMRSNAA
ncbi:MAG: Gfo/Idh/MocA family oxidoreductase [Thermomicrobiales bacterium]